MMRRNVLIAFMTFIARDNVSKLELRSLSNKKSKNTHSTTTILNYHKSQIGMKNFTTRTRMERT